MIAFGCIHIITGTKDLRKTVGEKKLYILHFITKDLKNFYLKRFCLNLFSDFPADHIKRVVFGNIVKS